MKQSSRFLIMGLLLMVSIITLNATVYENAEDGTVGRWAMSDTDPAGALISNIYDAEAQSRVIDLNGTNYENQYRIGNLPQESDAWNETEKFHLLWRLQSNEGFLIDVIVETQNGLRYIRYSDNANDGGLQDGFIIEQGIGYSAANGKWHNFSRDLEADLKEYEPDNSLISVNGLLIRGSCRIDNIELVSDPSAGDFVIYEDAEENTTNGWSVSSGAEGATISNVFDSEINSRVIELNNLSAGTTPYGNAYQFGGTWHNQKHFNIKWDMKTLVGGFIIDVVVDTVQGERYLRYNDSAIGVQGAEGAILYHGIGYHASNGAWNPFSRDLQRDLRDLEPDNTLLAVNGLLIHAKCRIDNIELFKSQDRMVEDAEDSDTSRWRVYAGSEVATITNIEDMEKASRVISLQGDGYNNQYLIGGDGYDNNGWNDTQHTNIRWSLKASEGFLTFVVVQTTAGLRYLQYDDSDFSQQEMDGSIIHYGLGYSASNGEWHTFVRDIRADIKAFEPNNELLSVDGFFVVGSANIDDLELFNLLHPASHEAGVTLTFDDHDVDGWYNVRDMYQQYGAKATFFVSHFHTLSAEQMDKLTTLEQEGHEIGCHSYDHMGVGRDYNYDTARVQEYLDTEVIPALNAMQTAGFNPTSFAYPYGEHAPSYDAAIRAYFPYLRITTSDAGRTLAELNEIYHKKSKYYNLVAGDSIDDSSGHEISEIRDALLKARKNGEIITFYAHNIVDEAGGEYNISVEKLQRVLETAKNMGLKFYTFKEAYVAGQ